MKSRLKIEIKCRNPKNFLEEIIRNKINIYNIELKEKTIQIIINSEDLSIINKIKLIHKTKIINYYGINRIKYLLNKYKIILVFFSLGIIINIILSNIIFNIDIETPNKKLKQLLIKDLNKEHIKKYHLKLTYKNKEKAKERILSKENDKIEWLEIEERGTRYIVKVEERKINSTEEKCYPRNIIAKKNAVITKINAKSGEISKKENDYVAKGEVLISGLIHNKEKIVSKKCAEGEVYGETWYKVKVDIPKYKTVEKETSSHTYGLYLKFFKKEIFLNQKYKTFHKKQYNIINSRFIPLIISIARYNKTRIIKEKYNNSNIDNYALKIAENKIQKDIKPVSVRNKKVLKKEAKNSKIRVEVFIATEEEITSYQDIRTIDIEKINKENEERE